MKQKIAIVGSTGYIGGSLHSYLVDSSVEAWGVGRNPAVNDAGDYRSLGEGLHKALEGATTVVHCASTTTPGKSFMSPNLEIDNVDLTINIAKACIDLGIPTLLYASSGGAIYGDEDSPRSEGDPVNPISSYGVSKLASETYLKMISCSSPLNIRILRVSNPYGQLGPHHFDGPGVIPYFIRKLISHEEISLYGNSFRDYVFIDDLLRAFVRAIDCVPSFEILNVGAGVSTTLDELLTTTASIMGMPYHIIRQDFRPFDVKKNFLNIQKAKNRLGWEPVFNLQSGIETYIDRAHSDFFKDD